VGTIQKFLPLRKANPLSAAHGVQWPVIEQVAAATESPTVSAMRSSPVFRRRANFFSHQSDLAPAPQKSHLGPPKRREYGWIRRAWLDGRSSCLPTPLV